jgi:hypothetical protein
MHSQNSALAVVILCATSFHIIHCGRFFFGREWLQLVLLHSSLVFYLYGVVHQMVKNSELAYAEGLREVLRNLHSTHTHTHTQVHCFQFFCMHENEKFVSQSFKDVQQRRVDWWQCHTCSVVYASNLSTLPSRVANAGTNSWEVFALEVRCVDGCGAQHRRGS